MKNTKLTLAAFAITAAALFSFRYMQDTGIKGTVSPADKAVKAWALSDADTLKSSIDNGSFEFKNVKPGTYAIIIEAQEPFAHTRKSNVVVADSVTNVGEIQLQQKQ
jgi:hypothetical protein